MSVSPIPKGFHTVTPLLAVRGADKLIEFMKRAFGATEKERHLAPDGSIMHAEVRIGDSPIMLGEVHGDCQPTNAAMYLYLDNADATYKRALQAGATSVMELSDQFWGDRSGSVKDPFGNVWWIATHKEDVSAEEMERRFQKVIAQHQAGQRPTEHAKVA